MTNIFLTHEQDARLSKLSKKYQAEFYDNVQFQINVALTLYEMKQNLGRNPTDVEMEKRLDELKDETERRKKEFLNSN